MAPPAIRKCSSDCPPKNISRDLTWYCFVCKEPIHLLCYEVVKKPEDIFIVDNITMVCDECLSNPKEMPSPKRKQPSASGNLVQSTIDTQNSVLTLSKTVTVSQNATPSKQNTVKQSQQVHTVIEALVQRVEKQTATIEGLKTTIKAMNETVSLQKVAVVDSIKLSNENFSSLKKSLSQAPSFKSSKSYAEMAKQGNIVVNETPNTSKPLQTPRSNKPVMVGTSNNVIGKPIEDNRRPKMVMPEKAIWLSRIHRDTTEAEIMTYIKESIGITSPDITVRKLVKKDRDLSSYTFVSFRVTCSTSNFAKLIDPMYWPSNCQMREFEFEQRSSMAVKFNSASTEAKNGKDSATATLNLDKAKPNMIAVEETMSTNAATAEARASQVTL